MKTIKLNKKKDIPIFLILGLFFPVFSIFFICFFTEMPEKLGHYDILESCESVPVPAFSVNDGIYEKPFKLEIQAEAGYDIYYTTDGSIPTVKSRRYKTPITINPKINPNKNILTISTSYMWKPPVGKQFHCIVIRARCFKKEVGYGQTKNIIYSLPDIKLHQGLNVVHILIETDSLFSQESGIYVSGEKYYSKKAFVNDQIVMEKMMAGIEEIKQFRLPANYHQRGKKWVRPAEFMLTDTNGKILYQQNVRLCINGNSTRSLSQKSLRIMPDTIRGDTILKWRFFENITIDTYSKRVVLRSSDQTMIRDVMIQQMAKLLGLDIQEHAPAVVYINGNYWGIHNIREKMDEHYFSAKYDVNLQTIDIIEPNIVKFGNEDALIPFKELINFIKENSPAEDIVYQQICSQIDIDNFIDYMITQTFFANMDWGSTNIKLYRISLQSEKMTQKSVEAGKWRWLPFDMDDGMHKSTYTVNMFERIKNERIFSNLFYPLFYRLMENIEFKEKLINRYEFVIKNYFTTELMLQQIEDLEILYKHEMQRHINRWLILKFMQEWLGEVETMKEFALKRPEIVLKQLETLK